MGDLTDSDKIFESLSPELLRSWTADTQVKNKKDLKEWEAYFSTSVKYWVPIFDRDYKRFREHFPEEKSLNSLLQHHGRSKYNASYSDSKSMNSPAPALADTHVRFPI